MRLDELRFQLAQEKGTTVSLDSKVDLNVKSKRRAKIAVFDDPEPRVDR